MLHCAALYCTLRHYTNTQERVKRGVDVSAVDSEESKAGEPSGEPAANNYNSNISVKIALEEQDQLTGIGRYY